MCVCASVYMSVGILREGIKSPGARVTGDCELLDIGAGN